MEVLRVSLSKQVINNDPTAPAPSKTALLLRSFFLSLCVQTPIALSASWLPEAPMEQFVSGGSETENSSRNTQSTLRQVCTRILDHA